jgi:hypothetical protein
MERAETGLIIFTVYVMFIVVYFSVAAYPGLPVDIMFPFVVLEGKRQSCLVYKDWEINGR